MRAPKWLALALAAALAWPAAAQQAPAKVNQPWFMQGRLTSAVSVTTSSAATALPSAGFVAWATNTGSNDAYYALGTSNSVSTTTSTGAYLKAGACLSIDLYPLGAAAPYSYIALIGSGGSTTVTIETGTGQPGCASMFDGTTPEVASPCKTGTPIPVPISQTTSTQILPLASGKKNYICSILTTGADAESFSLVEGTGSVCASNTTAIIGGTTAAAGNNFQAGGGYAFTGGGYPVAAGTNASYNVCLLQSGTGRVAGVAMIVQQ